MIQPWTITFFCEGSLQLPGFQLRIEILFFFFFSWWNWSIPSADSWQQVGLMLVTSFNCGWILSFSNLVMWPLGWTWGIICLIVVGFYTAYANWLLAAFHFIDDRRFIRYRDLMGYVYGEIFILCMISKLWIKF